MKIYFLFLLLAVFGLFNSCVKNNPDPSWIEVNEWTLEANVNAEYAPGELTHNITEAWVYIDDEIIGVFEVPFKIPVLKSGAAIVKIFPAIKNNGISNTKKIYPFMEEYQLAVDLIPNQTVTINPVTRYNKLTQFTIEDFEDPAIKISNDPNSSVEITTANDPLVLKDFNGNFYGQVVLDNIADTMWVAYTDFNSIGQAGLPRGAEVYLEIDFYNTNAATTGLLAISPTSIKPNQHIQLNSQNPSTVKWKKIYIDLREIISNSDPAAYFEQTFQALIDADDASGFIYLDNIKVVHF